MLESRKKSIGLDIADRSIALVLLRQAKTGLEVSSRARVSFPAGIVERGRIKDEQRLAAALRELFTKASLDPVAEQTEITFGLPESQVYFHIFDAPAQKPEEREELVRQEAMSNIPLAVDDLIYSHSVLSEEGGKNQIILLAASRKVVFSWYKFFRDQRLNILDLFDVEPLAARRGLLMDIPKLPVCIVDIGAVTSGIDIFDSQGLRYTYSILVAGDALTHALAKALNVSWEEAEETKKRFGLSPEQNKVLPVLVKTLEPLRDEITTAINFYKEKTGQAVSEIILTGGSSQLKGLVEYLSTDLEVVVRLGEPAVKIRRRSKSSAKAVNAAAEASITKTKDEDNDFYYIEALGLARRAFSGWWTESDPGLSVPKDWELPAAGGVAVRVEHAVREKEMAIERAVKKLWWQGRGSLGILLAVIISLGLIFYWYWPSSTVVPPEIEVAGQRPVNNNISSLVFPEEPLENNAGISEGENSPKIQVPNDANQDVIGETVPPTSDDVILEDNPAVLSDMVLINDTPTGWLNVRNGPGTNYAILTKVYPGKSYPLLQEEEKWYKISIDGGLEGWVAAQYTAIEDNN